MKKAGGRCLICDRPLRGGDGIGPTCRLKLTDPRKGKAKRNQLLFAARRRILSHDWIESLKPEQLADLFIWLHSNHSKDEDCPDCFREFLKQPATATRAETHASTLVPEHHG